MKQADYMNTIIQGDALAVLRGLPDESVQCCVTSPPYWGLRDYGVDGQLGLEKTPEGYVARLVEIFSEVKRALKDNGTLWLNLGDCYATNVHTGEWGLSARDKDKKRPKPHKRIPAGTKPKDLCEIPSVVAMALRSDGWWLRSRIPWLKMNSMPESVTDRPAVAVEYVFLLSKSKTYFYDSEAVRVPNAESTLRDKRLHDKNYTAGRPERGYPGSNNGGAGLLKRKDKQRGHERPHEGFNNRWDSMTKEEQCANGRNRRNSDWFFESFRGLYQVDDDPLALIVNPVPFKGAHFATFPPGLVRPMILAGSRPGDVVLDPFMGAGTTALVCEQLDRDWFGIELNPESIEIAEWRLEKYIGQHKLDLGN